MLQLVENVKLRFNHEMKAEWWRLRPKRVNNYIPSPVLEHDNNQDVRIFNHSLAFGLYKHVGQGFVKIKSVNVQTFTSILSKKKKRTWKHIVLIKALQFDSVGWFLSKVSGKAKCFRKTLPTIPHCQLSHVCPLTDDLKVLEFMLERRFFTQETTQQSPDEKVYFC